MKNKLKNILEPLLLGLILFDVILLVIVTFFTVPIKIEEFIIFFDLIVCILLLFEFFYHFIKAESKWGYFKEHWFELIAAIPIDFFFLRFFRFIRLLRIIKLFKIVTLLKTDSHLLNEYLEHTNLKRLFIIISFVVIIASIILFIIDPSMDSLLDSFWYVIVTITSVGYGDITPSTTVGKIIGIFLVIVGFLLLSIFIGAISSLYQSKFSDDQLLNEIRNQTKEINSLKEEINELKILIGDKNSEE